MSWDAELIHSWGRRGWQMEKWWASREKRSGVTRLRAERNPPDHFPQLISMHGRSEPQVARHAEWQHVENIWEYLLSHLDFPFFGMSRCLSGLAVTCGSHSPCPWCVPGPGHEEHTRVKVKVWFPTLFTILSLPAARVRPDKTVNPNMCPLSISPGKLTR